MPLLTERGKWRRNELYWHFPHYSSQRSRPSSAVRLGDHKLIEYFHDGHVELYNLKDDPGESRDLAASQPRKARELRAGLARWRQSVGAWMPRPNPDFDRPSRPTSSDK